MDYNALFNAGTYATNTPGIRVFAGTTDDAFWIDLGGAFDTLRPYLNKSIPLYAILTAHSEPVS